MLASELRDIAVPERKMAKREVDSAVAWADLPPDVVIGIADRLTNLDFFAFRSVCSSWRRPVSFPRRTLLSKFLPVKVPQLRPSRRELRPAMTFSDDCVLSIGSVYILRAPTGPPSSSQSAGFFLLFSDEFVESKLWLRNQLSNSLVSEFPSCMPKTLNLLDFDALEVAKCYSISSKKPVPPYNFLKQIIKVVVCSNGCAAVILCYTGELQVLNIGKGQWEVLHDGRGYKFDDIVEYEGKVFGVDRMGRAYSIEYDGIIWRKTVVGIRISVSGPGGGRRRRLVVSSKELYLLVRFLEPEVSISTGFKVFRLKLDERKWVQVTNLGDWTFFVGVDWSFSTSTEGFGGECKKNCILFTEESFPSYHSMERFYLHESRRDDLKLDVLRFDEGGNTDMMASPVYSCILWPPPYWLQSKLNPIELLQTSTKTFNSRIEGAKKNRYSRSHFKLGYFKLGYCKQQCLDYAQFFEAIVRFMDSEINAAKRPLLKCSAKHQDKMDDVNCKIEENHEAHSTWEQSEVLEKVYDLVQQAVFHFKTVVHELSCRRWSGDHACVVAQLERWRNLVASSYHFMGLKKVFELL